MRELPVKPVAIIFMHFVQLLFVMDVISPLFWKTRRA
jgi:hypothetical protein